jgi:Bacterial Ig-like domain/L,D-transpeptidase catalytic domain
MGVTRFGWRAHGLLPRGTALIVDRRRPAPLALTVAAVGAAGVLAAACGPSATAQTGAGAHQRREQARSTPAQAPATALSVVSVSPHRGAMRVDGAAPVTVQFSTPLAASSPMPTLRPAVPGKWSRSGSTLYFTPSVPFEPARAFTLQIPGGQSGVRSAAGRVLAKSVHVTFRTQGWSPLRLEQLLAQLHFLPLTWAPKAARMPPATTRLMPAGSATGEPGRSRADQLAAVYSPPAGKFTWKRGYPSILTSMWRPGKPGLILTGAVMAFEAQHHMPLDHTAGPRVWATLLHAVAKKQSNSLGYTYALVQKGSPETLTVWHNGHVILHTLANTGIPAAPTADGTFPVYLRFQFTIMSGQNPDGSHYSDPVWWVSYFNGGDAVHYFPRGSYGFPQSLGCVELQWAPAKYVWPYMNYGTLVSVVN